MIRIYRISLFCFLFLFASTLVMAAARKIVVFNSGVSNDTKDRIVLNAKCTKIKNLRLINGMAVFLPEQASDKAVEALLKNVEIARVDSDLVITASRVTVTPRSSRTPKTGRVTVTKPDPVEEQGKPDKPGKPPKPDPEPDPDPVPSETLPWGIDRIDADTAQSICTGLGIKVAVLDTGIDLDHPDLAANIKGDVNVISSRKSGDDDNGHGTHCAGIIAAIDNEIGVIGVAPQADLYSVKVLDRKGSGYLSDLVEGLDWCIANNIQVISMSLSSPGDNQTFHDAIT
ncbi:S8 family serine peptidase, partial [Elusimicrobiota bacterium]